VKGLFPRWSPPRNARLRPFEIFRNRFKRPATGKHKMGELCDFILQAAQQQCLDVRLITWRLLVEIKPLHPILSLGKPFRWFLVVWLTRFSKERLPACNIGQRKATLRHRSQRKDPSFSMNCLIAWGDPSSFAQSRLLRWCDAQSPTAGCASAAGWLIGTRAPATPERRGKGRRRPVPPERNGRSRPARSQSPPPWS
jgi:hypothetical protein